VKQEHVPLPSGEHYKQNTQRKKEEGIFASSKIEGTLNLKLGCQHGSENKGSRSLDYGSKGGDHQISSRQGDEGRAEGEGIRKNLDRRKGEKSKALASDRGEKTETGGFLRGFQKRTGK